MLNDLRRKASRCDHGTRDSVIKLTSSFEGPPQACDNACLSLNEDPSHAGSRQDRQTWVTQTQVIVRAQEDANSTGNAQQMWEWISDQTDCELCLVCRIQGRHGVHRLLSVRVALCAKPCGKCSHGTAPTLCCLSNLCQNCAFLE